MLAAIAACSFHAPPLSDADADEKPIVAFEFANSITDETVMTANVRLKLDRLAPADVIVDFVIQGGTAIQSVDYTLNNGKVNGKVIIPAGQSVGLIPVGIVHDVAEEPDETIELELVAADGATLGAQVEHRLTISANVLPRVAFVSPASSADEPDGAQAFGVTLTETSPVDIVVSYSVAGSASAADHGLADGTVTIPANMRSANIDDPITNDMIDENDETIDITITNVTNAVIGAVFEHVHTIVDEDSEPDIGFAVTSSNVAEGVGTVDLAVDLQIESGKQITIDVALGPSGSAAVGTDFMLGTASITFAPGETSKPVTITVVDDQLDEDNEDIPLVLSNAVHANLTQDTRTLTITDDDDPPAINFAQATTMVLEQNSRAMVTVVLSGPSSKDITFSIAATDGTAVAGTDFTVPAEPITIAAGGTSAVVNIGITNDALNEVNETATLSLTGLVNALPGTTHPTNTLTIQDNDMPPQVRFDPRQGNRTANEGDSGTTTFAYPVILSAPSGRTVTVGITVGGSAIPVQDFVFGTNDIPVTFAPGEVTKDLRVIVKGDRQHESDKSVVMQLQPAVNATNPSDNQVRIHTIKDDD